MSRALLFWLLLTLSSYAILSIQASEQQVSDFETAYQSALAIRNQPHLSNYDKRRVVGLLQRAAGVIVTPQYTTTTKRADTSASGEARAGIVEFSDDLHVEAMRLLAETYLSGVGVTANFAVAYELYSKLAELGDPAAQREVGFYHAWGITPAPYNNEFPVHFSQPDAPVAILNYYFAAAGNDSVAQLILAYRHVHGHGVPESCQTALLYYTPVAEKVVDLATAPGTLPQIERVRLTMKLTHGRGLSREHEVLHYQWFADMGYQDAQWKVGHMLSQGPDADLQQALQYLRKAHEKGSLEATAFLGHMYANGLGVPQDNHTAKLYFKEAADHPGGGHPSGAFGLGYMYLTGHGSNVDYKLALKYLQMASERNLHWPGTSEAWFHLAMMHYHGLGVKKNVRQAIHLLQLASQTKHVLSMYNLAMIHLADKFDKGACKAAVDLMKGVAEKGPWAGIVQDAYTHFMSGEYEAAFWKYLRGAEMGIEQAQINAAWMLSNGYGYEGDDAASVSVVLHRHAAEQGCVDSLLALGDSYYYGRGLAKDWHKAVDMYRGAADHKNAQALYNLGFMHQYGAGMAQDFHLAKRYYDKALEVEPKAAVALQLVLWYMGCHQWWKDPPAYLPHWAHHIMARLFVLSDSESAPATESPPAAGGVMSTLGSFVDKLFDLVEDEWLGQLSALSEQTETLLLLGLCPVLWWVLRRRQVLRRGLGAATTQQNGQAPFDIPATGTPQGPGAQLEPVAVPQAQQPTPPPPAPSTSAAPPATSSSEITPDPEPVQHPTSS